MMSPAARGPSESDLEIAVPEGTLRGRLAVPAEAVAGLVLFAHGSGSSRLSPRNRMVASALQGSGLATLLFDLLTESEETVDLYSGRLRFDIELLARRLGLATEWTGRQETTRDLPLGYFGSSTGAAAALAAAAEHPQRVRAVVSRGGRPDLAREALVRVAAPTLLIVGGADIPVLALNREAMRRIRAPVELAVVAGASHLFEEPGALEQVAAMAARWFVRHLERRRGDDGPAPGTGGSG